jgi:disulfide bond formation protein DsbB
MAISEELSKPHVGLPVALFMLYVSFIASLIFEYQLKIKPSQLCLAQRYCTAADIVFITLAFLIKIPNIRQKLIDFACLTLFWGLGISGYHLLIQYRILPEPVWFKTSIPLNASVEELHNIVRLNEETSCANLAPTIFDMPTTAFTFVMFVFLFIYISVCFKTEAIKPPATDKGE